MSSVVRNRRESGSDQIGTEISAYWILLQEIVRADRESREAIDNIINRYNNIIHKHMI